MKKLSLLMCLLFMSATACGKADVTESTTEATETTTEATTVSEATTETEKSEAEKLGYDKTYEFKTPAGGSFVIPEKFLKVDEESNQGGEYYKFEDKNTGMTIETWELQRYTRKQNMLDDTVAKSADLSGDTYYESMNLDKNEDGKVRISGKLKDGRHYVEIEYLYENMYHYITFYSDDTNATLCDEIADISESKNEFTDAYGLAGRLTILMFCGGSFVISDEELNSLTDDEVKEAINEIYAGKGFIFEDQATLDYFKEYSWYNPTIAAQDFTNDKFGDIEKTNLEKLQSRVDYSPKPEQEETAVSGAKFEMVRGGYYFVPDGFDNITKETYALRYVQEWQNYDLDMHMEITDAMQLDIPMTIDEEYEMYVNSYGEENLSLNKKEADGYILSGVDANGYVYYQKAKAFGDRYVCINITYPQASGDTCNKILEDFVFSFVYE